MTSETSDRAPSCPLCERIAAGEFVAENALAVAIWDAFPLNPGHVLVVTRRHCGDLFALSRDEQEALWALLPRARTAIEATHGGADGYNVGVNVGAAAGQTVDHVHVHLVPRSQGDVDDPRGGVRWVVPARAAYWKR